MSQRRTGENWLIYTSDTGNVLTVDQFEENKTAIWWLNGVARGDICFFLKQDLWACATRVDLLVLVLKDVIDISSECLKQFVYLQTEVLDPHGGELRLVNAKNDIAEKMERLRIPLALNVRQESIKQPQTSRPEVEYSKPKPVPSIPVFVMPESASTIPESEPKSTLSELEDISNSPNEWVVLSRHDGKVFGGNKKHKKEWIIGRLKENDICLEMPSISRKHLKIFYRENQWWMQDMGSKFGSWLDGQKLEPEKPVAMTKFTAVFQLSRYVFELLLTPYCDLINTEECIAGVSARLVHKETGEFLSLVGESLPLGRNFAPNDERVLHSRVISGCHAEIRKEQDGFCLVDTDSTNGTYLDDVIVMSQKPVKLTDGAHIRLGSEERGETFYWVEEKGEKVDEA